MTDLIRAIFNKPSDIEHKTDSLANESWTDIKLTDKDYDFLNCHEPLMFQINGKKYMIVRVQ